MVFYYRCVKNTLFWISGLRRFDFGNVDYRKFDHFSTEFRFYWEGIPYNDSFIDILDFLEGNLDYSFRKNNTVNVEAYEITQRIQIGIRLFNLIWFVNLNLHGLDLYLLVWGVRDGIYLLLEKGVNEGCILSDYNTIIEH